MLKAKLNPNGNLFEEIINKFNLDFKSKFGWITIIHKDDGLKFSWSIHKKGTVILWFSKDIDWIIPFKNIINLLKEYNIKGKYIKLLLERLRDVNNGDFLFNLSSNKVKYLGDLHPETYYFEFINDLDFEYIESVSNQICNLLVSSEDALRDFLFENPELIEPSLKAIDKEYETNIGRIDLLCKDKEDNYVVIELKKKMKSDKVLGQIQRYMGWIKEHLIDEDQKVRGIIIQNQVNEKLNYALKTCKTLQVKYYRFNLIISNNPELN